MAEPIRLSTKDRKLKQQFQLSPEELMLDEIGNQDSSSLEELRTAISKAKPGSRQRMILEDELIRIKDVMTPVGLGIDAVPSGTQKTPLPNSPDVLNQIKDFLSNMWSK